MGGRSKRAQRIFVAIPAYRDPDCIHTIRDLFAKADHPARIFVGVCWQWLPGEDEDLKVDVRRRQVRIDRHDARDSQGAGWARRLAELLRKDELDAYGTGKARPLSEFKEKARIQRPRPAAVPAKASPAHTNAARAFMPILQVPSGLTPAELDLLEAEARKAFTSGTITRASARTTRSAARR